MVQQEEFRGLAARPILAVIGKPTLIGFQQMNQALKARVEQPTHAHGMVMLELGHRFPPDADLDAAWQGRSRRLPAGLIWAWYGRPVLRGSSGEDGGVLCG